jgi:pyrroloquinoline-quinone synthase
MLKKEINMEKVINQVLNSIPYEKNPYFIALKEKQFDKEDFIETQIQFYFAVIFFSRPMAAAAAKVPDAAKRLEIIRNVWEEHGEGKVKCFHGNTFSELLFRLGLKDKNEIEKRALWPATRHFNTTLAGATALDEHLIGVSVMGIIERMFSSISTWIGQAIVDNGWLSSDKMLHYNLHETLDIKHAQDFFNAIEPTWQKKGTDDQYIIEQGFRLGAFAFNQFYENLYACRKQRLFRTATCPHTRS